MTKYSYEEIPVCYLANGLELKLPVHQFQGGEGPVFGISASIHGDEIIGVEIARRVVEILKNEPVHGTIKIMPVVNALSFEQVNRNTPVDNNNLNRVFPGNPNGMLTERIAHTFLEQFVGSLDYFLDLHSGGREPIVDYVYIQNDEAMSRSFGSKILYRPTSDYVGSVNIYAKQKGVKCMTVEIGGLAIREEDIVQGVAGVLNVLRFEGLIDGQAEQRQDQIVVNHIEHVNPHHGGLMVPGLSMDALGAIVEGHVTLAKIYNPLTLELLEDVKAPYERNLIILLRPTVNRVFPGDFSFMIGDLATAE